MAHQMSTSASTIYIKETTATCRYCGQEIVSDPRNAWVHSENDGVYCDLPVNQGNRYFAEPA